MYTGRAQRYTMIATPRLCMSLMASALVVLSVVGGAEAIFCTPGQKE